MCVMDGPASVQVTPSPKALVRLLTCSISAISPHLAPTCSHPPFVSLRHIPRALLRPQRLALCLKIALFFQLSVVVCLVLAHRYVDAGVGVLGVIFGLACVGFNSADDGFALQTVLCYTAFACVMLFWGMSRAVFHFIGKEAPTAAALAGWQASVYQAAVIADVAVYFCVFMLSYMLYSVRPTSCLSTHQLLKRVTYLLLLLSLYLRSP